MRMQGVVYARPPLGIVLLTDGTSSQITGTLLLHVLNT